MVVAGGMNILTNCDAFVGLPNDHFHSKTPGVYKTWDANADGYCREDGMGSIVMKRLEDTEADNDNIFGIINAATTAPCCGHLDNPPARWGSSLPSSYEPRVYWPPGCQLCGRCMVLEPRLVIPLRSLQEPRFLFQSRSSAMLNSHFIVVPSRLRLATEGLLKVLLITRVARFRPCWHQN
ncbi:uncharacterized protein BJX67DRAFT_200441 [Aspergillus lucknowensis]|uniref:Beta-ketoacyl synthase-like N-terminal domain-containing protein n=1 Tax=Aspergillus lucknowensis TaxID=176173 RepID=A0ABR4LJD4_9EURO